MRSVSLAISVSNNHFARSSIDFFAELGEFFLGVMADVLLEADELLVVEIELTLELGDVLVETTGLVEGLEAPKRLISSGAVVEVVEVVERLDALDVLLEGDVLVAGAFEVGERLKMLDVLLEGDVLLDPGLLEERGSVPSKDTDLPTCFNGGGGVG